MSDKPEQETQEAIAGLTQYDIINNLINKLDNTHYRNYELNQQNIWQYEAEQKRTKDLEISKLEAEKELEKIKRQFDEYKRNSQERAKGFDEKILELKEQNKELKAEVRKLEIELGL